MVAYLLSILASLQAQLKKLIVERNLQTEASKKLYETAKAWLGKDVTPLDNVPDDLACVEVLNVLAVKSWGEPAGGGNSTYLLYYALKDHKKFAEVVDPLPGDIILSPTGFGGKNGITNGHAGVVMDNNKIASNSSFTGLLTESYDLWSWRYRWVINGGYPMKFYRRIMV